jgi:hypothetical protein
MRVLRNTRGPETRFILADVDPIFSDVLRNLHYLPLEEGFAKSFPTDTPGLDGIFRNLRRCAGEMIMQTAGLHPVPWEECLLGFLETVERRDIDWWLCGSAALAVRGMEIEPRDIDLVVADSDAERLGELLPDYMIEPVVRVEDWFCNWFGRAFLHARLEWVGGVDERADQPGVSDVGPTAASRLETVTWRGRDIRVPPLDLQLKVSKRRGLAERVEMIERFLAGESLDLCQGSAPGR